MGDALKCGNTNVMKGVTLFGSVSRPMLYYALKSEAAWSSVTMVFFCHSDCSNIPEDGVESLKNEPISILALRQVFSSDLKVYIVR